MVSSKRVQVVNLVSNRLVKIIGKVENTERFLRVALYQVSSNKLSSSKLCTAFARLLCFVM